MREVDDPHCLSAEASAALLTGHPWRRLVALGDSIVEGVGEPRAGYADVSMTARIGAALQAVASGVEVHNLGARDLLAREVLEQQLEPVLALNPDIVLVAAGGNDALRRAFDADELERTLGTLLGPLAAAGALVVTVGLFDIWRSGAIPDPPASLMARRFDEVDLITRSVSESVGGTHIDLHGHPCSSDSGIFSSDLRHCNSRVTRLRRRRPSLRSPLTFGDRSFGSVTMTALDFQQCYSAALSRDRRFDGLFFVGVHSTGIYCRPSCPAPTPPKPQNVRFYRTTAAAQVAGLRACKRCRPDAVPGPAGWGPPDNTVGRAMELIADGIVDRGGVAALAQRLAVSERHLQRLLVDEVGAPALAIARSQRAQTARVLIESTELSLAEIAFGAGFGSVRQFNDTMRQVFATTPTQMRAHGRASTGEGRLTLRLNRRDPYDGDAMLSWLAARAIPGVEEVDTARRAYRRTLSLEGGISVADVVFAADEVRVTLTLSTITDLGSAVTRLRRLLDLDADPYAAQGGLARDTHLAPLVEANPGLRVPGSVCGHETAVRTILGQQVSLAAARQLGARLVALSGSPLGEPDGSLTHAFPSAGEVAAADLEALGLPTRRRTALRVLATQLHEGALDLAVGCERASTRAQLLEVPGVGTWTADYVMLRALGDPDAFPASDLGLRRGARRLGIATSTPSLAAASERWRPWRAYAAHHLWSVA